MAMSMPSASFLYTHLGTKKMSVFACFLFNAYLHAARCVCEYTKKNYTLFIIDRKTPAMFFERF